MNFLGLNKLGEVCNIIKKSGGLRKSLYKMFIMDDLKIGTLMGTDKFGNKYYENNRFFYGRNRWIEYAPYYRLEYDGSQVPAEWFGWLHYKTDCIPSKDPGRPQHKWMLEHSENLSGTRHQYVPYSTTTPKIQAWTPQKKFSRLCHGYTHFGFQNVREDEKAERVKKVFDDVAATYDKMNDAMSFGLHRIWKDVFMDRLGPTSGTRLLDVAGGTGDIAFRFLNHVLSAKCQADCHVTVLDINVTMLNVGKHRQEAMGFDGNLIAFEEGDAEILPYEDNSFNAYTIAFGIRNCTDVDKVLREAYRVLKPGGRFLCLEFSQVDNTTLQWLYDQYSFQIIPLMGQLIAGQWHAYQYLVESIRRFPNQEQFKNMIENSGFRQVTFENLTSGVVAIHSGFKL